MYSAPGPLVGGGDTPQEAYDNLMAALPSLIQDWLDQGIAVPEPQVEEELPSGRVLLRMPRSLHARVGSEAQNEGVSLNSYIVTVLEQAAASSQTRQFLEKRLTRQAAQIKEDCHHRASRGGTTGGAI